MEAQDGFNFPIDQTNSKGNNKKPEAGSFDAFVHELQHITHHIEKGLTDTVKHVEANLHGHENLAQAQKDAQEINKQLEKIKHLTSRLNRDELENFASNQTPHIHEGLVYHALGIPKPEGDKNQSQVAYNQNIGKVNLNQGPEFMELLKKYSIG